MYTATLLLVTLSPALLQACFFGGGGGNAQVDVVGTGNNVNAQRDITEVFTGIVVTGDIRTLQISAANPQLGTIIRVNADETYQEHIETYVSGGNLIVNVPTTTTFLCPPEETNPPTGQCLRNVELQVSTLNLIKASGYLHVVSAGGQIDMGANDLRIEATDDVNVELTGITNVGQLTIHQTRESDIYVEGNGQSLNVELFNGEAPDTTLNLGAFHVQTAGSVALQGMGELDFSGTPTQLSLLGAGQIVVTNVLPVGEQTLGISVVNGAVGDVTVSGSTGTVNIAMAGQPDAPNRVITDNLQVQTASVTMEGNGYCTVFPSDTLNAFFPSGGSGIVRYRGNPTTVNNDDNGDVAALT